MDSAVTPLLAAASLWALLRILTSLPARPRRVSARANARRAVPFSSLLRCTATLLSTPPAFSADQAPSPRRSVEPPWSETSGLPPLRPLVPARAIDPPPSEDSVVDLDGFGAGASYRPLQRPNADIVGDEPQRRGQGTLLFPSRIEPLPQPPPPIGERPSDPRRAPSSECRGRYRVVAGDSLWTIAGRVLDTEDPRRIARYWPRIHRANRSLIGTTPNLIRPGWVLELPPECD
ncbi:MAG: LysM peptidoglycan-binding domain-containing protein [Actinomycetota bacterium]|nr:LysM peptidoglycan-binding domain-containing protein [Actinomycetota bacterium]